MRKTLLATAVAAAAAMPGLASAQASSPAMATRRTARPILINLRGRA